MKQKENVISVLSITTSLFLQNALSNG